MYTGFCSPLRENVPPSPSASSKSGAAGASAGTGSPASATSSGGVVPSVVVVESPAADSDAYFSQRPWRSQINAWASRQSSTVSDPNSLEKKARELASRFGTPDPFGDTDTVADGVSVPRPTFWGGYRFWFAAVEIWLSGKSRFHERVRYERSLEAVDEHSFRSGSWSHFRLQP